MKISDQCIWSSLKCSKCLGSSFNSVFWYIADLLKFIEITIISLAIYFIFFISVPILLPHDYESMTLVNLKPGVYHPTPETFYLIFPRICVNHSVWHNNGWWQGWGRIHWSQWEATSHAGTQQERSTASRVTTRGKGKICHDLSCQIRLLLWLCKL